MFSGPTVFLRSSVYQEVIFGIGRPLVRLIARGFPVGAVGFQSKGPQSSRS